MSSYQRKYVLASFALTIISIIFLCISLATEFWIKGIFHGPNMRGHMNYGLSQGTFYILSGMNNEISYNAYLTCHRSNCAFSCRETEQYRLQEVSMIYSLRQRPNMECNDEPKINGLLDGTNLVSADTSLHTASYALLGLALLFQVLSGVLEMWNLFSEPEKAILEYIGILIGKIVSAIFCLAVFIWWMVVFNDELLSTKSLPFVPMIVGYYTTNRILLEYSYWFLLVPIISNVLSIIPLLIRRKKMKTDNPPIWTIR